MKKLFSAVLIFVMLLSAVSPILVFADETENVTMETVAPDQDAEAVENISETTEEPVEEVKEEVQVPTKATVDVNIIMAPRMQVVDSVAKIELYSIDGELLGKSEEWIGGITREINLEFEVPEFTAGEKFVLKLAEGLEYIKYYDQVVLPGESVEIETYGFLGEDNVPGVANSFALEGGPLYEQAIVIYTEGNLLELYPRARLLDDIAMAPVMDVAQALDIKARYDEKYNSVVCSIGNKEVLFNVGTAYATIFGEDTYLVRPCEKIDDSIYVPVRALAEAFGSTVETFDFGDHIDICLGESSLAKEYRDKIPVNKWGITSRTNYLVWVSKSEYRVRVYTGSKGRWEEVASFPCAIGAPGSPTITGSYEYQYRMDGWYYDGYYVGPCLVFHGNYALHSTLLRYNNTPYDNRTGVMISHGCIRMKKPDIDWLAARLPLKSRVYITN